MVVNITVKITKNKKNLEFMAIQLAWGWALSA